MSLGFFPNEYFGHLLQADFEVLGLDLLLL